MLKYEVFGWLTLLEDALCKEYILWAYGVSVRSVDIESWTSLMKGMLP